MFCDLSEIGAKVKESEREGDFGLSISSWVYAYEQIHDSRYVLPIHNPEQYFVMKVENARASEFSVLC